MLLAIWLGCFAIAMALITVSIAIDGLAKAVGRIAYVLESRYRGN